MPLNIAVAASAHDTRSSFNLSPDAEWIAHTWTTDEAVPEGRFYTPTGVSFAGGNKRKQAAVTSIKTGQVVQRGSATTFNWAPVWSPDANRVAYYSHEGGQAGIWIWEKTTGKVERFAGVIPRSFFGFEIVRWSSDKSCDLTALPPPPVSNGAKFRTFPWENTRLPAMSWRRGSHSNSRRKFSGSMMPTIAP